MREKMFQKSEYDVEKMREKIQESEVPPRKEEYDCVKNCAENCIAENIDLPAKLKMIQIAKDELLSDKTREQGN